MNLAKPNSRIRLFNWQLVLGYDAYHTHDSRGGGRRFLPDWIFVKRGRRIIYVELKKEGKKPTPKQIHWLTLLADTGAEVYLWQPSDFPEIQRILEMQERPDSTVQLSTAW